MKRFRTLALFTFIIVINHPGIAQTNDRINENMITRHYLFFQFGGPNVSGGSYSQPITRRFSLRAGGEAVDKGTITFGSTCQLLKLNDAIVYNYIGVERRLQRFIGLNAGIGNIYYLNRHFVLMFEVNVVAGTSLPGDHSSKKAESIKFRGGMGFSF